MGSNRSKINSNRSQINQNQLEIPEINSNRSKIIYYNPKSIRNRLKSSKIDQNRLELTEIDSTRPQNWPKSTENGWKIDSNRAKIEPKISRNHLPSPTQSRPWQFTNLFIEYQCTNTASGFFRVLISVAIQSVVGEHSEFELSLCQIAAGPSQMRIYSLILSIPEFNNSFIIRYYLVIFHPIQSFDPIQSFPTQKNMFSNTDSNAQLFFFWIGFHQKIDSLCHSSFFISFNF